MTQSELLDYINDRITTNGNNEITGPIDNDVRKTVVNTIYAILGDLSTANSTVKTDLVSAINTISIPQAQVTSLVSDLSGKINTGTVFDANTDIMATAPVLGTVFLQQIIDDIYSKLGT